MDHRRIGRPKMVGRHHPPQRGDERALRIGEEARDPRERLLLLGVEDVEDGADQQRVAGLLPMVAPLERAFGIDEDVGDVLDVADLVRAAADLEQRVVAGRAGVCRVEQQAMREARAPAGGQLQFSPLMSWMTAEPVQPRSVGTTSPTPLPAPGRRKGHDMLGTVMAQVAAAAAVPGKHRHRGTGPRARLRASSPSARSRRW